MPKAFWLLQTYLPTSDGFVGYGCKSRTKSWRGEKGEGVKKRKKTDPGHGRKCFEWPAKENWERRNRRNRRNLWILTSILDLTWFHIGLLDWSLILWWEDLGFSDSDVFFGHPQRLEATLLVLTKTRADLQEPCMFYLEGKCKRGRFSTRFLLLDQLFSHIAPMLQWLKMASSKMSSVWNKNPRSLEVT